MAPECLARREYSFKSDSWAYGVVLYEMYVPNQDPYFGKTMTEVAIEVGTFKLTLQPPQSAPPLVAKIMRECFQANPNDRPDFETIVNLLGSDEKTV